MRPADPLICAIPMQCAKRPFAKVYSVEGSIFVADLSVNFS